MGTMVEWVRRPICSNKTKTKIRNDTLLGKFPLFYLKRKHEVLIEVENLQVTVIKELKAKV